MLSIDPSLAKPKRGKRKQLGNVMDRHDAYAKPRFIEKITVLVAARGDFVSDTASKKLDIHPTNTGQVKSFFVLFKRVFEISTREWFDLIVCQYETLLYGFLFSMVFWRPLFVTVHGAWLDEQKKFKPGRKWFYATLFPFLLKYVRMVRVVSEGLKDQLVAVGIDEKKIIVIPTAVDLAQYKPKKPTIQLKKRFAHRDVVLYTGRLEEEKNVRFLLEVVRRVVKKNQNALFLFAGSGSQKEELKHWVGEFKIQKNVRFLGHVTPAKLPEYFSLSKLFVSPSVSESLGKAMIEASAAGLPVVAIENIGSKTVVQHNKTGVLISPGDSQQFADTLLSLLRSPKRRAVMGAAGKKRMKALFDYKKNTAAIPKAWKEAVEQENKKTRKHMIKKSLLR